MFMSTLLSKSLKVGMGKKEEEEKKNHIILPGSAAGTC